MNKNDIGYVVILITVRIICLHYMQYLKKYCKNVGSYMNKLCTLTLFFSMRDILLFFLMLPLLLFPPTFSHCTTGFPTVFITVCVNV